MFGVQLGAAFMVTAASIATMAGAVMAVIFITVVFTAACIIHGWALVLGSCLMAIIHSTGVAILIFIVMVYTTSIIMISTLLSNPLWVQPSTACLRVHNLL